MLLACALSWTLPAAGGPVLGDWDQDADRDLADFAQLTNCQSMAHPSDAPACGAFKFSPGTQISALDFRLFTCGFNGPGVPVSAVTVGPQPSPTTELNVTLTGTTAGAMLVQVTGGVQSVTVPTSGCDYAAFVQLRPNVVNHLFVTGIFGDGIASAPIPASITHDKQAPGLFIDFPAANAEITAPTTDVAGRVGDTLSGFAGLTVTVAVNNGPPVPAAVEIGIGTNGTFFVPQSSLDVGANTITTVARDAVGNSAQRQTSVTRVEIPPDAAVIELLSGNGQSAPIDAPLPDPIVVQVTNMRGGPLQGKLVNFNVIRSDGRLAASAAELTGHGNRVLQVFTDAEGVAKAFWRVGSDAGCGNNRVEVTSTDVVGTTFFCASATHGPAAQINVGSGNNQHAEAGGEAPEPLIAWVNDACNPVRGIPVTFTVIQGGGKVNGSGAATLDTDLTGHAEVRFTLGEVSGNNVIEATFPGNPNPSAIFTVVGLVRDESRPTRFAGLVLDNAGQPIQGATCALSLGEITLPAVLSDLNGQFQFDDVPGSGPADLRVNGATATRVGGAGGTVVPANSFPFLHYTTLIVPHASNSLPTPVLLPRLDPANVRSYSRTQDTELTVAGIAGLKMIVKAGSMSGLVGGQLVPAPDGIPIYLNQVHHDDIPMPLPDGAAPPFAWTLQPAGAHFDPPVKIIYPNMSGLPAGAIANFLSFNHDTFRFEIVASGHVTDDGQCIESDPGVGITTAGWGCNCPPYAVTGDCCKCNAPCQRCLIGVCVPTGNGSPCGGGCCAEGQSCCEGNCIDARNICCDNGVEFFPGFPQCCGEGCCIADGVCCDDECQLPGSTCCFAGLVCSPPTPQCCGQRCCDADEVCCDGTCFLEGSICCASGGACRSPNSVCCGGFCLPAGSVCCPDGSSCPATNPVCCGDFCLPAELVCCPDGSSCPATRPVCCGDGCCSAGNVCCYGICLIPGAICCPGVLLICPYFAPQCCGNNCCCRLGEMCCIDGEACSCVPTGQPCP